MSILNSFRKEEKTKVILLSNEQRHCANSYQRFIFACYCCRTVTRVLDHTGEKNHSLGSLNLNSS